MKNLKLLLLTVVALLGLNACEKMELGPEDLIVEKNEDNVFIRANMFSIVPFSDTRAMQNITSYCNRLCFVIYQDDAQVKKVLQKQGDSDYGQVSLRLASGTYMLLVVGHSSLSNPSLTHPEEIKFTNTTGYTDTFYYYGELEVTDEAQTHNVVLQRATSMLRIKVTDDIPDNAAKVWVHYTGGCGILDATIGMGGQVKSQQYTIFDAKAYNTPMVMPVYTFLPDDEGFLNVSIRAFDVDENVIAEKEIKDVPMKHCMVTEYTGTLFTASMQDQSFSFEADTSWEVYHQGSF